MNKLHLIYKRETGEEAINSFEGSENEKSIFIKLMVNELPFEFISKSFGSI